MTRIVIIDDHDVVPSSRSSPLVPTTLVVSWNTFSPATRQAGNDAVVHLGDLLHDREEELQRQLLEWMAALARKHTANDSALPMVFPNLHSWWLLRISEKNYASSPEFVTILKLHLLREICDRHAAMELNYEGKDRRLEAALAAFAATQGLRTNARVSELARTLEAISEPLQAARHFLRAFSLAVANKVRRTPKLGRFTWGLVGYLVAKDDEDRAHSPYWLGLRELLPTDRGVLWLYHRSDEVSCRDGRVFCRRASRRHPYDRHLLIDDLVTPTSVVRGLTTYLALARTSRNFSLDVEASSSELAVLGAGRLFEGQLRDSLFGSHAAWTSIHAHVYDRLAYQPGPSSWIHLWENKPLEHCLNSAIARNGSARTIAYAHSVIRRRDHRYYDESALFETAEERRRPAASHFVVNGSLPRRNLEEVVPPRGNLVVAEALRYQSLKGRSAGLADATLVVGDISQGESIRLLNATRLALEHLSSPQRLLFKPHPGNLRQSTMAQAMGFSITTQSLAELAPSIAVAVVGAAGAASLDLTILCVPVVTLIDPASLNLSPLVGAEGARFARSVGDLKEFLSTPRLHGIDVDEVVSRANPPERWIALLGNP